MADFAVSNRNQEAGWVTRMAAAQTLAPEYQELKFTLHRKLVERINLEVLSSLGGERVRGEIRTAVAKLLDEETTPLSRAEKDRVAEEILNEVFGLGPLEPLLQDPTVSDILVTTPKLVYVERFGKLHRTPVEFKDNAHLLRIIERIVSRVGRRVDESSPLVDARLPDGSRVNAVIAPIAVDGPLLSIRRFRRDPILADELVRNLALTEGMLTVAQSCVKARLNIIISGGTGAGKTTLLNVLSGYVPENERIVTIEDAAELQLRQTHVARMETRPPNIEGHGAIKIRQLVINALRMRPDRIIVGEVRGEEPDYSGFAIQRRHPARDAHDRVRGHGRRPGDHAGHFRFREDGRDRGWARDGAVPPDGHPAEVLRPAAGGRNSVAGLDLPDNGRDQIGRRLCGCW
jgi:pilus assembly protein CpaF